jgi:DeoR family transcriptional regulator, fructose operon transcriptional repressor
MSDPGDSALNGTGLFVEERQTKILEFIEEHRKATVAQLCQHFGVSSATIRNDLRDLEASGLILRTHGGAMVKTKTGFELDSSQKQVQNLEAKRRIAQAALRQIEDGDTVILDTGTTTLELARLLAHKRNVTVVTNDLEIARLLEASESLQVVVMGGILRRGFHCTMSYGTSEREALEGLSVDKAFMGVNSFTLKRGASTPDIRQAETKKGMIAIATSVILLCDSSKFGRTSFVQFARPEEVDTIITDSLPEAERLKLEEHGIQVIVAE